MEYGQRRPLASSQVCLGEIFTYLGDMTTITSQRLTTATNTINNKRVGSPENDICKDEQTRVSGTLFAE
jgi:hypothetical protein